MKMPFELAHSTVRDYLCADCWSQLVHHYDAPARLSEVFCSNGCSDAAGFVTRAFVESRTRQSSLQAAEARSALRAAVPWLQSDQSKEQLLKELGF